MLKVSASYLGHRNCNLKCMLQSASSYLYENDEMIDRQRDRQEET